jgi:hypothetical protein
MIKNFCDCCQTELYTGAPEPVLDENGNPKRITQEKFDPISNKMVSYPAIEFKENPNERILIQMNLNNHDMLYKEFCLECYKKISEKVKEFWNFINATSNI